MKARPWRWIFAGIVFALALSVAAVLGAGHFLAAPAQAPVKAELIVVLAGDSGGRLVRAAELYRKGLAGKVLVTGSGGIHSKARIQHLHWRARYLLDEGIPESALLFDRAAANSWDEALYTLRLMQSLKMDRVLVVSDPPHMRRLSWAWGKVFSGSGKTFVLVASDLEDWDASRWWATSASAQFVFSEYIKLAYYVAKY